MSKIKNIFCRICGQRTWSEKVRHRLGKFSTFSCLGSANIKHFYSIDRVDNVVSKEHVIFSRYDLVYDNQLKKLFISKTTAPKDKKEFDLTISEIPFFISDDQVDNYLLL